MKFQSVKNLNDLKRGATYQIVLKRDPQGDGAGEEPQAFSGALEWVRTEPYQPEWGFIKLSGQEGIIQVGAKDELEARQADGAEEPRLGMANLMRRLEQEEERAMQINRQVGGQSSNGAAGEKGDGKGVQGTYWEGYMMALRKTREIIKEYEIARDWLKG